VSGDEQGGPASPPFFFVHVMKAAGTTLRTHLQANFPAGAVYPDVDLDLDVDRSERQTQNPNGLHPVLQAMLDTYTSIEQLRRITPERRAAIRAYAGHFPFTVTREIDAELITMTALRDPFTRTLSYLRMNKRLDPFRDASLDEIYDHQQNFEMFIHDHQTKVFAIEPSDHVTTVMDIVPIDDHRLAVAKANLASVDVVGLAERFDDFLDELHRRFGLRFDPIPDANVSTGDWPVSTALRRRIEDDNRADFELYQYARALVAERTG
jgi:hypothetical protein